MAGDAKLNATRSGTHKPVELSESAKRKHKAKLTGSGAAAKAGQDSVRRETSQADRIRKETGF